MNLPDHYATLHPFRELFRKGRPALMYHKLGWPRPGDSRKGLFVPARLFARQLAELRSAGFESAPPGAGIGGGKIALTFDDGYASAFRHALEPLRANGFRAIQFLVAGFIGKTNAWDGTGEPLMDRAQVREWLAAGHWIGAHSVTHPRLTQLPEDAAREEIAASRKRLEDGFGVEVRHFCYPFGDWNERTAELVAEAGCETACTTDFGINTATASPFALRRVPAYAALRSLRELWLALTA